MANELRILPQQPARDAVGVAAPRTPEQERLRRSAQDFESLLVGTMLRTMRETTKSMADSDDDSSTGAGIMNDVMDEHLAVALAHRGGMGLGNLLGNRLEEQRLRQTQVPEPGAPIDHTLGKEKP